MTTRAIWTAWLAVCFVLVGVTLAPYPEPEYRLTPAPAPAPAPSEAAPVAQISGQLDMSRDEWSSAWGPGDDALDRADEVRDPFARKVSSALPMLAEADIDLLIRWSKNEAESCLWVADVYPRAGQTARFCRPDTSWLR